MYACLCRNILLMYTYAQPSNTTTTIQCSTILLTKCNSNSNQQQQQQSTTTTTTVNNQQQTAFCRQTTTFVGKRFATISGIQIAGVWVCTRHNWSHLKSTVNPSCILLGIWLISDLDSSWKAKSVWHLNSLSRRAKSLWTNQKSCVWKAYWTISNYCPQYGCSNIARECQRQNAHRDIVSLVSLCHYVPMWCQWHSLAIFEQPYCGPWKCSLNLPTLFGLITFKPPVTFACKGLGFPGNKSVPSTGSSGIGWTASLQIIQRPQTRNLTRHNWSHLKSTVNPSCILWGHWFVLESQVGWQMHRWAKSEQTKKCGKVHWTFPLSAVCVQISPENVKDKMHWLCHYVTMSLCPYVMSVTSCFSSHCT